MPTMNCIHLRNDLYVQFKAKHVLNCPAVMNEEYKLREPWQPFKVGQSRLWNVNFCKDHRNKIEVPDPLAVEDLISSKLNNKRKLARLITQYRDMFSPSGAPYTHTPRAFTRCEPASSKRLVSVSPKYPVDSKMAEPEQLLFIKWVV